MAKSLSPTEIQEMKGLVVQGVAPEDIAKRFDVAISTVHYHKGNFKKEGLEFPSVKGKRPVGQGSVKPVQGIAPASVKAVTGARGTYHPPMGVINQTPRNNEPEVLEEPQEALKFIVNGVSVQISSKARNVSIQQDYIRIDF